MLREIGKRDPSRLENLLGSSEAFVG
ncbi:hypothetical protein [Novipirellula aureliae]